MTIRRQRREDPAYLTAMREAKELFDAEMAKNSMKGRGRPKTVVTPSTAAKSEVRIEHDSDDDVELADDGTESSSPQADGNDAAPRTVAPSAARSAAKSAPKASAKAGAKAVAKSGAGASTKAGAKAGRAAGKHPAKSTAGTKGSAAAKRPAKRAARPAGKTASKRAPAPAKRGASKKR